MGRWALPDAPGVFDWNLEAGSPQGGGEDGGILPHPLPGYFRGGEPFGYIFDSWSPYEERGRYRLYRDGYPIEEVFFTPRPQWYDRKTSSGTPMPSVIHGSDDNLTLAALTYCEYGKDDLLCRYCNINAAEAVNKELGLVRLTAKRDQDIYETILAACQEGRQYSIGLSGGVILDSSKEADMYARLIKVVRRATKDVGYEARISVICQAMERGDQMKLKEAGASHLKHNLEVWDPRLFEIFCPGKAKYVGREGWLERLVAAVEVFGRGNVATTLLQGLEMVAPYGFKSEDEGAESYLEGVKWMVTHGIAPQCYPMRGAPGTEFAGKQQGRTEYHLRLQQARSAMCKEHGLPLLD